MSNKHRSKVAALSPVVAAMIAVTGSASANEANAPPTTPLEGVSDASLHVHNMDLELDLNGVITYLDAPLSEELLASGDMKCSFYSTSGGETKCTFYSSNQEPSIPNARMLADAEQADFGKFNV